MRKSSFGGRLSIAGNPARVLGGGITKAKPKPKDKSRSLSSIGQSRTSTLSGAGSSRMSFLPAPARPSSGIGVRGRTDVPKDPRPITDKKYIASSIKGLMEFLADHNYPHPISHKLLMSPTSKDFFKIFTFMYSLIRPNYKQAAKMEEEVPRILKDLAYPFSFSKQYLYSVGSPHTWPHLLAALMWMVDLLKFTVINSMGNINDMIFQNSMDFSDQKPDNQIYFDYVEKSYIAYMKGDDEFKELDDELVQSLKMAYEGDNIEALENKCAGMERELIRVSEEEAEIEKLKSEISKLDIDTQQAVTYLQESDRYTDASKATINEKDPLLSTSSYLPGEAEWRSRLFWL